MFRDIVIKRYLLSLNGFNKYIVAIGDRDKVDSYVVSKFGPSSISSSEELDGYPIILPDLIDEATESNMLNKIFYV